MDLNAPAAAVPSPAAVARRKSWSTSAEFMLEVELLARVRRDCKSR
jgi:hypothetical protein